LDLSNRNLEGIVYRNRFSFWLLMGFFKAILKELEDPAMVNGLTRFPAF